MNETDTQEKASAVPRTEKQDRGGATYDFAKSRVSNLFRRANGSYYGRCMAFGKRHKKSFGKVTLEEAQEELRKWMSDLQGWELEPASTKPESTTMGQILDETEESMLSKPTSPDHRLFIKNRFKFIRTQWSSLPHRLPAEISQGEIQAWLNRLSREGGRSGKGYSKATLRGTMLCLRAAFRLALEAHLVTEDPCEKIPNPVPVRDRNNPRHQLSAAEFDMVLAEMRRLKGNSAKAADLADLLAATGARIGEIVGHPKRDIPPLRWRAVDWERREITIFTEKGRVAKGQNAEPRIVPFHPRLETILLKLKATAKSTGPNDLVCSVKVARRSLQGACRRLYAVGKIQIQRLTHHDLRHLFATWCIEAGIDIAATADLLGHRDGGALMLMVYRHKRNEHLHAQAKKLASLGNLEALKPS
jgi:integrase